MNIIKSGFKSLEFYLLLAAGGAKILWNDFPDEAFAVVAAYVIARTAQKGFGLFNPTTNQYSWQTSEFWTTILFGVAKSIFPDLPEEAFAGVISWIGLRTGLKSVAVIKTIRDANGSAGIGRV